MSRAKLSTDILILDRELTRRCDQLRASGQHRLKRLRSLPPLYLLGGGAIAGLASGVLVARGGRGFLALFRTGVGLLRTAAVVLPLAFTSTPPSTDGVAEAVAGGH